MSYWKASQDAERSKLGSKDSDWKNLAGLSPSLKTTRTRNGGNGRPDLKKRMRLINLLQDSSSSSSSSASVSSGSGSESDWNACSDEDSYCSSDEAADEIQLVKETTKPPATRVILEVDALTKAFEANAICQECAGSVSLDVNTMCLASSLVVTCDNVNCGYVFHGEQPAPTKVHEETLDKRERSTDYAVNVLYVTAFLSMGDGCSEAARLLELLGLPNDTTMESRSFTIIEDRIGPIIRTLTRDILTENLVEEVRLTMDKSLVQDHHDFDIWKSSLKPDFVGPLMHAKYPQITVSFDMAWQQRSSGNSYNSPSGHAIFVGALTRKPLILCVKSKLCNECRWYKKKNPNDAEAVFQPDHQCWKNHVGSSKSMEAQACLDLTTELFNNMNVIVKGIVIDDDSSTKAQVRWSNKDWMLNNNTQRAPRILITKGEHAGKYKPRPNSGKLPRHIPEPSWLHDPNHRKRVLTGDLYKLHKSGVANNMTMTKMDICRIGKNYGYMMRSLNNNMSDEAMLEAGKAVLDHHFDLHDHCSARWCRRKTQSAEERVASQRYYRSMTKDAKLYQALDNILSRFVTLEKLKEVSHGLDTQMNESFNNAVAWLAPKNKVYCASGSLTNRISIALGVNALGSEAYYTRLYKKLGITMTGNIMHCLKVKGNNRNRRLLQLTTRAYKVNRRKSKNTQLAAEERKARSEANNREGTYRSGMNMEEGAVDGHTLAELLAAAAADPNNPLPHPALATRKKASRRISASSVICPLCNKRGHKTAKSKHCLKNPINIPKSDIDGGEAAIIPSAPVQDPTVAVQDPTVATNNAFDDIDDADRADHWKIQDEPLSDVLDIEQFYDAAEDWSDIEEEQERRTLPSGAI
jgi:hypothetical protein